MSTSGSGSLATIIGDPKHPNHWRTLAYRQQFITRLDQLLPNSSTTDRPLTNRSAKELETQIYSKSTSKEYYLHSVAKLMIYIEQLKKERAGSTSTCSVDTNTSTSGSDSNQIQSSTNIQDQQTSAAAAAAGAGPKAESNNNAQPGQRPQGANAVSGSTQVVTGDPTLTLLTAKPPAKRKATEGTTSVGHELKKSALSPQELPKVVSQAQACVEPSAPAPAPPADDEDDWYNQCNTNYDYLDPLNPFAIPKHASTLGDGQSDYPEWSSNENENLRSAAAFVDSTLPADSSASLSHNDTVAAEKSCERSSESSSLTPATAAAATTLAPVQELAAEEVDARARLEELKERKNNYIYHVKKAIFVAHKQRDADEARQLKRLYDILTSPEDLLTSRNALLGYEIMQKRLSTVVAAVKSNDQPVQGEKPKGLPQPARAATATPTAIEQRPTSTKPLEEQLYESMQGFFKVLSKTLEGPEGPHILHQTFQPVMDAFNGGGPGQDDPRYFY